MTKPTEIRAQACAWVIREDRNLNEQEREAFETWLKADVAHRVAYLQYSAIWRRTDRLAVLKSPARLMLMARTGNRAAFFCSAALAAAALVGLVVFANVSTVSTPILSAYSTTVGGHQSVQLPDGTRVDLNTNTSLKVNLSSKARSIALERGEAYFQVARDPHRRFEVVAGKSRITDLGTKFSVRYDADQIRVVVKEGSVNVEAPDRDGQMRSVSADADSIVVARADGMLILHQNSIDIENKLSWRVGVLTFNQQSLGEAAEEFNRYNNKRIVVVGPARQLRIGGSVRLDNGDVFTTLLRKGFGLKIKDDGKEVIVSE